MGKLHTKYPMGLPRNILDIVKAINMALDIHPEMNDERIAAHVGVRDYDVRAVREQRAGEAK